jgi:hypothetical protein
MVKATFQVCMAVYLRHTVPNLVMSKLIALGVEAARMSM